MASIPYSIKGAQPCEKFPSAAGQRVLNQARKYHDLGVQETGINSGPYIDTWTKNEGIYGVYNPDDKPWCGCFAHAMYTEVGVNDDGLGSSSTGQMYDRAREKGLLSAVPYPGCYVVYVLGFTRLGGPISGGKHVDIFERWHNKGQQIAIVIGGNVGDAVTRRAVDFSDRETGKTPVFLVPKALRKSPKNTCVLPTFASISSESLGGDLSVQ